MRDLSRLAIMLGSWLICCAAAYASISELPGKDIGLDVERYALVIGNSQYTHIDTLPNTANDARAMARALSDVGFDVIEAIDLDRVGMQEAIGRFLNSVRPGSEALLYYAGHGVELDGQNYLLPTDIRRLDPSQQFGLRSDGISLTLLMEDLQSRRPRVSLLLLDACRNNPFPRTETRGLGGRTGLARVDPPQGTIVIYAAGSGELALDSLGASDASPNGLFTRNLLGLIREPGLEIRPMVQELKERVYTAALSEANHTQRPSYYDGLIGKFYFLPAETPAAAAADPPERTSCEVLVDPAVRREELLFLDPDAGVRVCREAMINYPDRPQLAELLEAAEEQRAAQKALLSKETVYSEAYLKLYPAGRFAPDIRTHLASLQPAPVAPEPESSLVPEAVPEPEPEPVLDPIQLALRIQTELNRLGCDAGAPDGVWGRKSEAALRAFDEHSDVTLAALAPSNEVLRALTDVTGRVCPIVCRATEVLEGDRCVAKTCPSGQRLSSKGVCYTPQQQASQPSQTQRPSSSGCFVFNGQTYCE